MIYFLLPSVNPYIYKNLDMKSTKVQPKPYLSLSLSQYLYNIKIKIDYYENDWDTFKKYTNPFEYINSHIPSKNKCISKYKPLSRSYYKMIEIIDTFNLLEISNPKLLTFHLAEGPGGFIEALVNKRNNKNDTYIGMTLLDDKDDYNIPAWKKSEIFLKTNSNVYIENGKDKTGNILVYENLEHIIEKYDKMDIITGDGGFDFSMDFNNQEINIIKLLYAQMCYAVCLQKKNGSFILKIFDCFMKHTLELIYLLSSCYSEVYITKPQTSRYANSEKYLVCKGFLFKDDDHIEYFKNNLKKIIELNETDFIESFLNLDISYYFLNKLEEHNAIFGQQQIETINNTINLIENTNKNDKIDQLLKNNIQKSMNWCIKYNVPYNIINQNNVFLQNEN